VPLAASYVRNLVQPGEPATRFRARAHFDNAAVVAGSAEDLTVSAVAGDTAACFVAGEAASSAAAFAAAALASFPSGLPGSTAVGAVLASATSALLPSIAAGALLSPAVAGAALEAGPLPVPLNEILASHIGKTISPETVTPIGLHPPGGGPSSENRGLGF
jgi:hypothetical protein